MYKRIFIELIILQNVLCFSNILRLNNPLEINKYYNKHNRINVCGIKKTKYIGSATKF